MAKKTAKKTATKNTIESRLAALEAAVDKITKLIEAEANAMSTYHQASAAYAEHLGQSKAFASAPPNAPLAAPDDPGGDDPTHCTAPLPAPTLCGAAGSGYAPPRPVECYSVPPPSFAPPSPYGQCYAPPPPSCYAAQPCYGGGAAMYPYYPAYYPAQAPPAPPLPPAPPVAVQKKRKRKKAKVMKAHS